MNKLPSNYGDIYKGFFSYLPVVCVSFDKAGDDDEQEYKYIDWSEDFIDPGWFLHPKWQEPCTNTKLNNNANMLMLNGCTVYHGQFSVVAC